MPGEFESRTDVTLAEQEERFKKESELRRGQRILDQKKLIDDMEEDFAATTDSKERQIKKRELEQDLDDRMQAAENALGARKNTAKMTRERLAAEYAGTETALRHTIEQETADAKADTTVASNKKTAERDTKVRESHAGIGQSRNLALAKIQKQSVDDARKEYEVKRQAWVYICEVLELKDDDIRKDQQEGKCMSGSKFAFLFVILGCELDLYGFTLAFIQYWQAGFKDGRSTSVGWVMRVLLIIGPSGYVLAVITYVCSFRALDEDFTEKAEAVLPRGELPASVQKEPVHLRLYHFLPIYRYYLLIKDQVPEDVEGLFRVNGLSTFTIGAVQIMCAVLALSQHLMNFDIFLKIGAVAQVVNILVTLLYFATPVAQLMKAAIAVDAMVYASNERLRAEFVQYEKAAEQYSKNPTDVEARDTLKEMHSIANHEILEMSRLQSMAVDTLDLFTMQQKFKIRRLQQRRKINEFAKFGQNERLPSKRRCFSCCSRSQTPTGVDRADLVA